MMGVIPSLGRAGPKGPCTAAMAIAATGVSRYYGLRNQALLCQKEYDLCLLKAVWFITSLSVLLTQ